ncbi:MAG: CTP synthase [Sulfurimonas sp.]|jgi:CTP synthase|uniref:CTP synthase n=1 Tax=unclassified Sulfurimonas TaxID=2623549 RepID=UPI0008D429D0|nr:CTP synthase [Sulfurimonas sp. RIFOXYB12_FULL_35_9]MBS4068752.1 CTP synthase [Sulfurimonas sp.]MDX9756576.1 CTP synthase [Sulfurimonas sp.]OHE03293.1 MAG: CTP synthase [Sulfurimonas sp. RIFOXYB12_FULL_35_9]OHE16241.1 MAG: CTP synthase [Sulfurimonas sp. RIFOXYD12_FULL_36_11]
MTKYIFVTGGVLSSLGKGITAASIGTLLKHSGIQVGMLKIDPYINVDPGTMSPLEHGEVFVTKDGAETDLDIGNYERFLDTSYLKSSNFTTGQIYSAVIERERAGGYLGQTIQVIPHIVGEIVKRIKEAGEGHDILIVELGGTVGDIEGLPFMEAIRQMKHDDEVEGTFFVHVTLIPFIKAAGELKSKPTQHSVQELRRIGITPQMIIARSENALPKTFKKKLAMSCDVSADSVIEALDAATIYDIPITFLRQNILKPISKELGLGELNPNMEKWDSLVKKIVQPKNRIVLGFVGKYLELKEAYKSLTESLIHAGAHLDTRVDIHWVDSEKIEERGAEALLSDCDSVLVAGGFGNRGVEGKIEAIKYARENKIPYLGICLGMQLTLVEYARNVLGFEGANSVEFDENTPYPMIYLIDNFLDQSGNTQLRTHKSPMGGTLRLGEYPCDTLEGSIIRKAYGGAKTIHERHRHRYEANPTYRKQLEDAGMIVTGESNGLIETVEIKDHPWFLGVQFHPEFTSRLQSPNPSILAFVTATLNISQKE